MVAEPGLGNARIPLPRMMQEVAHLEGALMFGDEIRQGTWQVMAAGEFEALIHVSLEYRRAGQGIIQLLVGVEAVLLILDEP